MVVNNKKKVYNVQENIRKKKKELPRGTTSSRPRKGVPRVQGNDLLPDSEYYTIQKMVDGKMKKFRVKGRVRQPRDLEKFKKKAENQGKALELRMAGFTYAQIGQMLNLGANPKSAARIANQYVKDAVGNLHVEPAEEYLNLLVARLEYVHRTMWRDFLAAVDSDERIRIGDFLLRLDDRIARHLNIGSPMNPTAQVNVQNFHNVAVQQGGPVLMIQGQPEEYLAQLEKAAGHRAPALDFKENVIEGKVEDD